MSIDPAPSPRKNQVQWIVTGCLGVLGVACAVWIAYSALRPGHGEEGLFTGMLGFFALDILALITLGVWVLRPPLPGAMNFLGRWAGKFLLFLGLGLAIIIFFFATCFAVLAAAG